MEGVLSVDRRLHVFSGLRRGPGKGAVSRSRRLRLRANLDETRAVNRLFCPVVDRAFDSVNGVSLTNV